METITGMTIQGECLSIDGKTFVDCLLVDCVLEYSGGPVSFERTNMRSCRYTFFGRARRTVHFLQNTGLMPFSPTEWAEASEIVH